ncbi:hypothetical protein Ct9H90mP29_02530 [bacterium]|nr:MAG: hypothetical protein Ct9H90mP29_02530 [bacterium]
MILKIQGKGRYLYDIDHPYSAGIPGDFSSWEEWWRDGVTSFVSALHDSIQSVKPYVRLSAAVFGRYNWGDGRDMAPYIRMALYGSMKGLLIN